MQPTDDNPAEIVSHIAPVNLRRLTRCLTCHGMIERTRPVGGGEPYWRHLILPADPHHAQPDEVTR